MVVLMTNELEMDKKESKSSLILDKLKARKKMKQSAAWVISGLGRMYHIRKMTGKEKTQFYNRFIYHLNEFKALRR
jgi:hypothetical protein